MRPKIIEFLKYAGGLVLAVLLFAWIFRGADLDQVREAVGRASISGLVLSGLLQIGHSFFRVLRWNVLLRAIPARASHGSMWIAVVIGYMVSWILPGRLGELVRPALLSGREDIPLVPCVGTVVIDRLLDMISVVALFGVGLLTTPLPEQAASYAAQIRGFAAALLPIVGLALVALGALARWREPLRRRYGERPGLIGRGVRLATDLVRSGDALRRPGSLLAIVLTSAAAWIMIATGLWVGIRASGADVPYFGVWVLLPAITLGGATPTPGGAGGFHAAVTFGLTRIFGIESAVAIGTGLLLHLTAVVPAILGGLGLLAAGLVRWSDVRRIVRQTRDAGRLERTAEQGAP